MKKPSKPRKQPPPPIHRPGPFHSKYSKFALEILQWRRDGWTWKQVVDELGTKGCKADEGGVCRFIKRFQGDKPYGIGQAPTPLQQARPAVADVAQEIHTKKEEDINEEYRKASITTRPKPKTKILE